MDAKSTILVVEDKKSEREAMARFLRMEGYHVLAAPNPEQALQHLGKAVDLVISDLRMGEISGTELLRRWRQHHPATAFIMVTAHGDVESAVEAMKLGAQDYLSKPVNPDELSILVGKCLTTRGKEPAASDEERREGFEKMIGNSRVMLKTFDQARRAAKVESTVLVTGESGTGKELMAEGIHRNSPRQKNAFVTVNMAAVPENLVESELFGHMKGAFTGATGERIGRFEAANKGTLFIDEIGDFALASQAKLLRVLENHTVTPIGSNQDRKVDVRVLAATSRNLEEMVKEGKFREDLYYRLNVITIQLPPLRARPEDIPLLVRHFLKELCQKTGRQTLEVDPPLMRYFENYEWPGNVRQLRNCLESMVVMATDKTLTLDDLPPTMGDRAGQDDGEVEIPVGTTLEDLERTAVEQALEQFEGNRTHAAESLGISVRTLQRKLKAWGIADHDDEE
jgi:DNA-binding NtrC family response regulator